MKEEIRPCVVLMRLERRLIFKLFMYSRSRLSSSVCSLALHLTVSMPRRLSIIWLFRAADWIMVSSLMRLYGYLNTSTSRMLTSAMNSEMENSIAFMRNRMMPVMTAMEISITRLSAMLVKMDLMVFASE